MTEDQFANIDSLSETVKSIQNCLQCTICLEMISSPVKTRCGHTFCRTCIGTVLNKKNSKCPLCNANLQRRSISKDTHTGMCISSFERLVRAIREDINIDILSHTKNPCNTREGYPTPEVSRRSTNDTRGTKKRTEKISSFFTKKTPGEQSAGPSNRDILDETSASCYEYKKDNAIKKDDSAERRNGRKESSSDGLSGVYPLLFSPRKNENAKDEVISAKEERIESWLETLPDTELLENPLACSDQEQQCLDDTITVISEFSSVSCAQQTIKKENEENEENSTTERLTERDSILERVSDSMEEQRLSKASSRGRNNTRGKNKGRTTRSFPGRKTKVDSTECKLKYKMTHAKVRERERSNATMEKSAKTLGDSLISTTDAADLSKHLAEPGNTTRETWNTVVRFGKEMRTKRNKLKSLDVSVQSTSGTRFSDEFVSHRTTKNRKVSTTNLQIRSKIVGQNDSIEKQNENDRLLYENKPVQCISPAQIQNSFESKHEQKPQQHESFISLDEEGRVPISSLRRDQMNDIIGITIDLEEDTDRKRSTENLSDDHGTVPKKRLSLRKRSDCSKNSDSSPPRITPIKVNLEERYELLRASPPMLSPKNAENTPTKADGIARKMESIGKLSLKKRTPNNTKPNEVPISYDVSQLSSVKCNLMEQMNGSEVRGRKGVDNAETTSKIDRKTRNVVREEKKLERDVRTNLAIPTTTEKTHIVPFSKLGKVFKKRRKVKFYKLGSLRRESTTCTLSTSILNASRVNVITFLASEDTLETTKTSEEECNLENGMSSSSINRIDVVDKINDEIKTTKYLSQSQDSLGVLFVSVKGEVSGNKRNDNGGPMKDNSEIRQRNEVDFAKSSKKAKNVSSDQNETRIFEQKETRSKPMIISVVKMMSPEKDSQLKFLNLNSPSNTIPERIFVQQMANSKRNSTHNLPDNISEQSDTTANDNTRKRKRLSNISDKIITDSDRERITKNSKHDLNNENYSNSSVSSENVTQIEKLVENANKHAKTRRTTDDIISLSSDESNPKNKKAKDAPNESKKQYKRIVVPTSGSDTDASISTRKTHIIDNKNNDNKNVSTTKRKRSTSTDSDSDTVVKEIMTSWCNDLDTSKRFSKKGKVEETKVTKASSSRTTVQQPESLEFDSWNILTPGKQAPEKGLQDRSNNDIIDKVRLIRMNEDIESITKKNQDTIGDNFDEAMADVMTHSLETHFFPSENTNVNARLFEKGSPRKNEENRVRLTSSYVETNDLFAETNRSKTDENSKDFDKTLIENLNGSNKENDVLEENARFFGNNGQRDTSNGGVRLTNEHKIDKLLEGRSTPMSDARKYKESKNKIQTEEEKSYHEYDSLMNVTQDQLLLKALEEDLFGSANFRSLAKSTGAKTSSPERRLEGESRTPRKMGKRNLRNKDAESSSDENDIIENTPQSEKFMEIDHSTESRARKALNVSQTTPVSRKNFKATTTTTAMTPTTLVGKLKTPIDQNKIRPLYQSTPKIIQATSNREKEPSKFVEENKKALEPVIDSRKGSVMQVKDESTRSANRSRDKRQLCFVWSSLAVLQIESIKKLADLFGASCTQNFIPTVTHVIVSTKEENNAATKTLKFLQGIAYRKFVVGFKWVADCLKAGRLLDEEPYEAVDCYTLEPGPRKSRLRQSNLFNKFAFLCVEPFPNITVVQCQDLLKGVGATIVQNIDALAAVKDMYKVILLQNEVHKDEVVAEWYTKTNAVPVSCDWIVECISQYRLVSCYMYLHEIVPEDILKSGYPEEMIDPEEFNSTCDTSTGH